VKILERPGYKEIEAALSELAATADDYHIVDTPERLIELEHLAATFIKIAVESKVVTPSEMRITKMLFDLAADKWLRLYEAR